MQPSVRGLAAIAAFAALLACTDDATAPTGGRTMSIDVKDNFFSPGADTVSAASTITWTWRGGNQHNVSFNAAAGGPNSITQITGTFQRAFPSGGTFSYVCTIHEAQGMKGTITVQ